MLFNLSEESRPPGCQQLGGIASRSRLEMFQNLDHLIFGRQFLEGIRPVVLLDLCDKGSTPGRKKIGRIFSHNRLQTLQDFKDPILGGRFFR
jgi:hypothetical protein